MTTVTSRFEGPDFGQIVHDGRHTLRADTGPRNGGADAAMDPHGLLASALAACTGITVAMYARRKGWPLKDAVVTVSVAQGEQGTSLERTIALEGPLDAEQCRRLMEIAERCPIHKALGGPIQVTTQPTPTSGRE